MENHADTYDSWHTPQRQSPAAIIIMLVKTAFALLKIAWPVFLLLFFKKKNDDLNTTIILLAICFCIIAIIDTFLSFWYYRFHIKENNFIIKKGWLQKKTLTIPIHNIHAVNLEQSVWQQLFNVTKLSLDSAGSEKLEVEIHALPVKKAEILKQLLLQNENKSPVTADNFSDNARVHKLSNSDLLKLSLSANHLEAFFILLGLSLNVLDDIKRFFSFNEIELIKTYSDRIVNQTIFISGIIFIIVALVSIITSIIRTLLKYYKFTIEKMGMSWRISFGLFTNHQKLIPFNKIQILSWKASWLRRKLNFWILHVQSIGHDETKRRQHTQIPVTSLHSVLRLVPVYQQSDVILPGEGLPIQPDYWKRKILLTAIPITLIFFIIFYLWIGITGLLVSVIFFYLLWHYKTWYKNFRWQVNEEGLQIYAGIWGRRYTLLTWKKIQQIQLNQNLYQRSHKLCTITFITAGGTVKLPYIKYDMAKQMADRVLYLVESKEDKWM